MSEIRESRELTPEEKLTLENDKQVLTSSGIEGLAGRVKFGLDPQAMLVLPETKKHADRIIADLGADPSAVETLIEDLHKKGPWAYAEQFSASTDPAVKAYLTLAAVCHEVAYPGYSEPEYLEDRSRVIQELATFQIRNFDAAKKSISDRVQGFEDKTVQESGKTLKVAMAEGDPALPLSIRGYKGCVMKSKNMRFAQTSEISDTLLEQSGLAKGFGEVYDEAIDNFKRVSADTPKCRVVWVKVEESGKDISEMQPEAKRISGGFVLTYQNEDLALDLVRKAIALSTEPDESQEKNPGILVQETKVDIDKVV